MISIAMAIYNGEKFLHEQLTSIINQSISDWELIICDDCSSDSSIDIVKHYSEMDSRIKIYCNEKNLGFKENFAKAISLCSGEYIALSDQDDIWEKDHLKTLLMNIADYSGITGNALIMNGNSIITTEKLSDRERYYVYGNNGDKLVRVLFYGNPFQGASSLYRKDLFRIALPIPDEVVYHDAWFSAVACCLNGLNYTPEVVTNYRLYGGNASGTHNWGIIKQFKILIKRKTWETDRIVFCDELIKRIPKISKEIRNIIDNAKEFHLDRINGKKIKTIKRILLNYKKIYSISNYKYLFTRCLAVLFRG